MMQLGNSKNTEVRERSFYLKPDIMLVEERVPIQGIEDDSCESEDSIIERIDHQKHDKRIAQLKDSWVVIQSAKRKAALLLLLMQQSNHLGISLHNN